MKGKRGNGGGTLIAEELGRTIREREGRGTDNTKGYLKMS